MPYSTTPPSSTHPVISPVPIFKDGIEAQNAISNCAKVVSKANFVQQENDWDELHFYKPAQKEYLSKFVGFLCSLSSEDPAWATM